jgi:hypothetical protein
MIIISIYFLSQNPKRGRRGRDRMVVGNITTYAIVPITTEVVISNLDQGDDVFHCLVLNQCNNSQQVNTFAPFGYIMDSEQHSLCFYSLMLYD